MLFARTLTVEERRALIAHKSRGIENARFLCVLLMSYVHLGLPGLPGRSTAIYAVLVDVLGRSSVPLLSVVSGLLIVSFYSRRSWLAGVRDRAKALILPMIAVNALAVVLMGPPPQGSLVNAVTAIGGEPVLLYMSFLRDLFVLCALAPALIWLVRRAPWLMAGLGLAYYVANVETLIIFRPQIAGFFLIGIFIGVWGAVRIPTLPVVAAFALVLVLQVAVHPQAELYDLLVRRPVTAAAFWVIARDARHIPRFGKAIFAYFLLHGILFATFCYALAHGWISQGGLGLWLAAPPLCFLAVVAGLGFWRQLEQRMPEALVRLSPFGTTRTARVEPAPGAWLSPSGTTRIARMEPAPAAAAGSHAMVGMTKLWSMRALSDGQRWVTVLTRVKKRTLSVPYWLTSPKPERFQPPKL